MKGQTTKVGIIFLLIPIFFVSCFIILPTIWTGVISFFSGNEEGGFSSYKIFTTTKMIDISNFPSFPMGALIHNIIWILISLPLSIFLGLIIAAITHGLKGGEIFRWIFFLPLVMPGVVMGTIGSIIFHAKAGIVPNLFRAIGIEGLAVTWFTSPNLALLSCILIGLLPSVAFSVVFYCAGVDALPREVTEAAQIDGASSFKTLTKIHWPMLKPVTLVTVFILLLSYVRTFDVVYVMTHGGPGESSNILSLSLYMNAFFFFKEHVAAAIGVVLFLTSVAVSFYLVREMVRE